MTARRNRPALRDALRNHTPKGNNDMSSTNKTANLQLNQWVGTDPVLMADFNADNAKIDAAVKAVNDAIAALPNVATGSYTGNGNVGSSKKNSLTFSFKPKLVIVLGPDAYGLMIRGNSVGICHEISSSHDASFLAVTWSNSGINWYCTQHRNYPGSTDSVAAKDQLNASGKTYYWVAIG